VILPRLPVWKEHDLSHITEEHPERRVSQEDVRDVLSDPNRSEWPDPSHGTIVASGRNSQGVAFVVAFVELSDGSAFPVHARRGELRANEDPT
jgi:hypothetical protein